MTEALFQTSQGAVPRDGVFSDMLLALEWQSLIVATEAGMHMWLLKPQRHWKDSQASQYHPPLPYPTTVPSPVETHTVGTLGVGARREALAVIAEGIYLLMEKSLFLVPEQKTDPVPLLRCQDGSVACNFSSYFSFFNYLNVFHTIYFDHIIFSAPTTPSSYPHRIMSSLSRKKEKQLKQQKPEQTS